MSSNDFSPEHDDALDSAIYEGLRIASLNVGSAAYLCDLQSMRFGQWRSRESVYPASVIKVPIMTEAFHRFADGTLSTRAIRSSSRTTTRRRHLVLRPFRAVRPPRSASLSIS